MFCSVCPLVSPLPFNTNNDVFSYLFLQLPFARMYLALLAINSYVTVEDFTCVQ